MSSLGGSGSACAHRRPRGAFLVSLLALVLAWVAVRAAPAHAETDDLAFAERLIEAGHLDLAQKVYDEILGRPSIGEDTRAAARRGLVLLKSEHMLRAVSRGRSYPAVRQAFLRADEALDAHASAEKSLPHVAQARLDRGVLQLTFARLVADALRDESPLVEDTADAGLVRDDARAEVARAITGLAALRDSTPELSGRATCHLAEARILAARLEPECPSAALAGLHEAAYELEALVAAHAEQPLAVHGQECRGRVWLELARCAEEPAIRHVYRERALACFQHCVESEAPSEATLVVVARAYLHLCELALTFDASSTLDVEQVVLRHLDRMLDRHPSIQRVEDGLRATVEHARLLSRVGQSRRALELAREAYVGADQSKWSDVQRAACVVLEEVVLSGGEAWRRPVVAPEVLRLVADEMFAQARFEDAIRAYRRVISRAAGGAEDFLAHRWHAWARIAASYRRLDDRLGEALAYEPVHEAWTAGQIPYDPHDYVDRNTVRAGDQRRRALYAWKALAEATGWSGFELRARAIEKSFLREYPGHATIDQGPWNAAREQWVWALQWKRDENPRWKTALEDARRRFVALSRNEKSRRRDTAWVYVVRSHIVVGEWAAAIRVGREALAYWDSPRARRLAKEDASLASRRYEAQGAVFYWIARSQLESAQPVDAIETLAGWHAAYAELPSPYPELGYHLLIRARLAVDMPVDATWDELVQRYPGFNLLGDVVSLLVAPHERRRAEIEGQLRNATDACEGALGERLYESLLPSARYIGDWAFALEKSGSKADPDRLLSSAAVCWRLAHLRPAVLDPWWTCHRLYERFLAQDTEDPASSDTDVRLAKERMRVLDARLAQPR